jgi:hypothetical protein
MHETASLRKPPDEISAQIAKTARNCRKFQQESEMTAE